MRWLDIREKFRDYMQEYSPVERPFYGYLTSVVVRRLSLSRARSFSSASVGRGDACDSVRDD